MQSRVSFENANVDPSAVRASSELRERSKALLVILWAGLVAGVLDISDAFLFFGLRGAKPIRILQSIAGGLLGVKAFQMGFKTAAIGLLLHFFIALSVASVYYVASRKLKFLRHWPVVWGLVYGAAVYGFMNIVVLPLSAVPKSHFTLIGFVNGILAIMLLVGLPISLIVNRYSK